MRFLLSITFFPLLLLSCNMSRHYASMRLAHEPQLQQQHDQRTGSDAVPPQTLEQGRACCGPVAVAGSVKYPVLKQYNDDSLKAPSAVKPLSSLQSLSPLQPIPVSFTPAEKARIERDHRIIHQKGQLRLFMTLVLLLLLAAVWIAAILVSELFVVFVALPLTLLALLIYFVVMAATA